MTMISRTSKLLAAFSLGFLCQHQALADDIDIFTGSSGGSAAAPNVMFLLDNTTNWASNATNVCVATPSSCPTLPSSPSGQAYNHSTTVGGNELNAIIAGMSSLYTATSGPANIKVGLATLDTSGSNGYAYVRFGARNIGDTTTYGSTTIGATAYSSLISVLSGYDPNGSGTKIAVAKKDESEALFELYQYYKSLSPGGPVSASGGYADYIFSTLSGAQPQAISGVNYTAYSDTSCGSNNTGCLYNGPATACSKNFVIYIVNHGHSNNGSTGASQYFSLPPTLNAIAPWTVSGTQGEVRWITAWANFLYSNNISLYIVDVGGDATATNAYSITLQQAAKLGGGKYYALTDASTQAGFASLVTDLNQIFTEIQAINSTFASVSLPVSATNRSQNQNQVFIPMFRPDPNANPLWKGNLKQYQLVYAGGAIELGDSNGLLAINPNTGFAAPCAQSYWSSDSSTYWQNITETPLPQGQCSSATTSVWSDIPDGSIVEKGGVAEVIRKGNNPSGAATWNVNRTIYTQPSNGGTLTAFSSTSTGFSTATGLSGTTLTNLANFIMGQDVNAEYNSPPPPGISTTPAMLTRPSLHGDTIHSQPRPVDYGSSPGPGVFVYYGSNDGMLRAVDTSSGKEQWAFVAPEFYPRLNRLKTQSPTILYPNEPTTGTPAPTAKDYFFDGSIGLYQNIDNSKVWIYPSMRRGGRMLYAFDVTTPTAPVFKWKVGCPDLTDNANCVATSSTWTNSTITPMGQTWSAPNVAASVLGYTGPVVVMGGGYDACEDANSSTPSCSNSTGSNVYVIDADTGALIKTFSTGLGRSVAADVALISVAKPDVVDHAYAADTGGNIYRIDFSNGGPTSWVMNRIAYTNGAGRKFLYPPALLSIPTNQVYLAIGSGDREHPLSTQYPYTTPIVNRFYSHIDNLTSTTAVNLDTVGTNAAINVSQTAGCNASNILPGSPNSTWFLELNQNGPGEQTVTSAVTIGGMVTFSTNRPVPPASGTCSSTLGEARGYWLNLFNGSGAIGVAGTCGGTNSATFVGGGMPPSPVFAIVQIGSQTSPVVIGAVQRGNGANSPIAPQVINPAISPNRKTIYWKSTGSD